MTHTIVSDDRVTQYDVATDDMARAGAENAVASKSIEMVVSGGACLSKKQDPVATNKPG